MNAPLYTTDILRLAASLGEQPALARIDGTSDERAPTCGSRVQTQVQLDEDGRIVALAQQVHACAFGQASAALLASQAGGRGEFDIQIAIAEISAWLAGDRADPGSWPGFESLAPARNRRARHPAIVLPFRSLLAALRDAK